jgi:hypothetical protein
MREHTGTHFSVAYKSGPRAQFLVARLAVLEVMGLARRVSTDSWEVRGDFTGVLQGMQKIADRQKTLYAGGVLRSDARLPILPLNHVLWIVSKGGSWYTPKRRTVAVYAMRESTDTKIRELQSDLQKTNAGWRGKPAGLRKTPSEPKHSHLLTSCNVRSSAFMASSLIYRTDSYGFRTLCSVVFDLARLRGLVRKDGLGMSIFWVAKIEL